ncbi:MAG TPA: PKD domain-containing protein, partial [Pirellulaceae bacterium]|nr:PKD domain-containing protein [Pirellulaceae bacterium]
MISDLRTLGYPAGYNDYYGYLRIDGTDGSHIESITILNGPFSDGGDDGIAFDHLAIDYVTLPNLPPTAHAGAPYSVGEGGSIQFDASGSSDPDQSADTLVYEWDFNYDGAPFNVDATGVQPTV